MVLRRQFAALLVVVCLVSSAGCTGLVFGDTVEFTASQATVDEDALEETGYERTNVSEHVVEEDVEAAGVSRTVIASTWIASYEKTVEIQGEPQGATRFWLVSTPGAEVLGKSFNPADGMSHDELLDRFQSQFDGSYEEFGEFEKVDSRTEVVLDEEVEVTTFETSARMNGEEIDVYVHVTTVGHGDDMIVAAGAHPAAMGQERANVYALLQAIEHEA